MSTYQVPLPSNDPKFKFEAKDVTGFWKADQPNGQCNNWYPCEFTDGRLRYNCSEQYFMNWKGVVCGDPASCVKIMKSKSPKGQKALGRKVINYKETVARLGQDEFDRQQLQAMFVGNMLKFSQNPPLLAFLLDQTGTTYLVEASPLDAIWGIKLGVEHKNFLVPSKWKGTNWLGRVLWHVRNELRLLRDQGCKDLKQAVLDKYGVKPAAASKLETKDKKRKEKPKEQEDDSSSSSKKVKEPARKKARFDFNKPDIRLYGLASISANPKDDDMIDVASL